MSGTVVTGGAGFIGSNLVDHLLQQGHEVTVIDNFSEGKVENLAKWKLNSRLEVIRGDVKDYDLVRRACDHKDYVFHLAAMSRIQPSITDPLSAFHQNVIGTANVAEACRQGGVKRLVYSASSSAYGRNSPPMTEDMKTDCLNPYSLSKLTGEKIVELYRELYGLSTVSLRYFNVFGPRHQEEGSYATVIAIFLKQRRWNLPMTIVGDGEQRRDFTFVADVVHANMLAMMNRDVTGVVNIGTGKNHSINEVAALIDGPTTNIPERLGEARVTLADNTRAREELGWKPSVDLQTGIEICRGFSRTNSPIILL